TAEWIRSSAGTFSILSWRRSSGVAADKEGRAPSIAKRRSGTRLLLEAREETRELRVERSASREAAPVPPQEPDELVATIDRHSPVLARASAAIHEKRFYIGLQITQHGILRHERRPGVERERRLDRAARARIERDRASRGAASEKECNVDR